MKLLDDHGEPFEVAIVAYALLLSKSSTAEAAFGILAKHARREGNWPFLRVFFGGGVAFGILQCIEIQIALRSVVSEGQKLA